MPAILLDSDLLGALLDGPLEQPMWSGFLDLLRRHSGADRAFLWIGPPDQPRGAPLQLHAGPPPPDPLRRALTALSAARDPVPRFTLREERVYALPDLLDPAEPAHQHLASELRDRHDMADLRVLRVTEPGGLRLWLGLSRPRGAFTAANGALLGTLAPLLRRALRGYADSERQKARSQITAQVMARLDFGWIALDGSGQVIEQSAEAEALLRHGAGLRRTRSGRLIAADPQVDRQLSAALRSLADGHGQPRALNVSADPWVSLLLLPARPDPASPTPEAAIIAYIQGDNRSLADRHEQIAELFGLLPSEARLALALSRGLSIAEAAAALGLTVETARNYSKKIYAKTGARGQAELVRFVLTSVLSLA